MYYGWFKFVANKEARYRPMWFCLNDKDQYVARFTMHGGGILGGGWIPSNMCAQAKAEVIQM